ncbi:MAG: DNA methyltransferase [Paracoccaceae bacterium]
MANHLYYGDNLSVLRDSIPSESVDLIYLDPPFNSNAGYNVLFKAPDGSGSAAQIEAFDDTWHWNDSAESAFADVLRSGNAAAAEMLRAMRGFLGENDMMAYLAMMAARLIELYRVLRPTGSLYLHCDPTASHYLKILLDAVFGKEKFANEIIWKRTSAHSNVYRSYGDITDTILFYRKTEKATWNQVYRSSSTSDLEKAFPNIDPDGRRWRSENLRNPGHRPNLHYIYTASNGVSYEPHPNGWTVEKKRMELYDREGRLHFPSKVGGRLRKKQFADEFLGTKVQNLWDDIGALSSHA